MIQAPGHRDFLLVNVYLYTGIGLNVKNLELLKAVGQVISAVKLPVMVMGDFNLGPAAMQEPHVPSQGTH